MVDEETSKKIAWGIFWFFLAVVLGLLITGIVMWSETSTLMKRDSKVVGSVGGKSTMSNMKVIKQ